MTGRLARLMLALGLVALSFGGLATRISLASEVATFSDDFDHAGYGGNDGSVQWNGPWSETVNNGSTKGRITVERRLDACPAGCLSIGQPGLVDLDLEIERSADLDGADEAHLSITYLIDGSGGVSGTVRLEVSDGGSGWETLATFSLAEEQDEMQTNDFDITEHAGPETTIRFTISGLVLSPAALLVDELTITASWEDEEPPPTSTTSTTSTSTSTSQPAATTTTRGTTTTTTMAPTTTTTSAGTSTTTTRPGTTTLPPSTTTTSTTSDPTASTSDDPAATTTTSIPRPTDDPGFATNKEALVSSSARASEAMASETTSRNTPEPLHVVTFVNAAESVRSTAVYGAGVGLLLAGFLLIGFEDRPQADTKAAEKGGTPRNLRRSFDP